jgi:hypothetical protein
MPFKNGKVCLRATSEAGARWPIFGLVVATTTGRRDNKDQMIRPLVLTLVSFVINDDDDRIKQRYTKIISRVDHRNRPRNFYFAV